MPLLTQAQENLLENLFRLRTQLSSYLQNVNTKIPFVVHQLVAIVESPLLPKILNIAIVSLIAIAITDTLLKIALIGICALYGIGLFNKTAQDYLDKFLKLISIPKIYLLMGLLSLAVLSFAFSSSTLLLVAGALILLKCFALPLLQSCIKSVMPNLDEREQNASPRESALPRIISQFFDCSPSTQQGQADDRLLSNPEHSIIDGEPISLGNRSTN